MNYQDRTLNSILPWNHINNNPTSTTTNENDTKRRRTDINQSTDIKINPNSSLPPLTHIYNKYVPVSTTTSNNIVNTTQLPTTTQWQGQQLNRSQSLSGLSTMSTSTIIPKEDYSGDQLPMQTSLIDLTLDEKPNTIINHSSQVHPHLFPYPQQQQQQPNQKSYHRPHSESSVFSHHTSKYNLPTSYSNTSSPILNHHRHPIVNLNDYKTINNNNNNQNNNNITRPHSTSGIRQYSNTLPFNSIVTQPPVVKHQQHQQLQHHHHLYKEQLHHQLQQQQRQSIIIPDKKENKEIINNNTINNNEQMYNNINNNNNSNNHNNNIQHNNNNNDINNINHYDIRIGNENKYDICLGMLRSDVVTKSPLNLVKDEFYEPVEMRFEGCRESNYTFTITSKKNGSFFGWVPFTDTRVLGPLTTYKLVIWDVVIPRNKANHSRTPLYIILYCQQSAYESICNILSIHKVELKDPPFYNPACQYLNPKFGKQNEESTTNQLRKATSLPSTPYPHYEYNNYDPSNLLTPNNNESLNTISTQSKQQIAQLLESIPTSLKKRKNNNNNNNNEMVDDNNNDNDDEMKDEDLNMEGLTIKLLPHQEEGIRWMMDREENETSSGGMLADDMGLGKTIQTIGLVISGLIKEENKQQINENKNNKTLIVAPLALINQWASEFKTKTIENGVKVLIHHGPQRTQNHKDFEFYDVVITTYQMVASDIPSVSTKKRKKQQTIIISDDEDEEMLEASEGDTSAGSSRVTSPKPNYDQSSSNNKNNNIDDDNGFNPEYGPLFQLKWHRVVLDEAQQIKNHTTRVSIACSKLLANKRWCLTGTPIQNRVEELYSLFRFLRIKPLSQLNEFRKAISLPIQRGQMEQALDRLKLVLMAIMLRRTKDILGSESSTFTNDTSSSSTTSSTTSTVTTTPLPMQSSDITTEVLSVTTTTETTSSSSSSMSQSLNISLPNRQKQDILLPFAPSERTLYNLLTEKTTNAVRKLINSGKGTKSFMNMLCMVLRLRQACNHPQLVLRSLSNDTDAFSLSETGMIQSSSSKPRSSKRENSEIALQKVVMSQMASDLGWKNNQIKDQSSKTLCEICRSPIIMIDIDETNEVQYCSDCLYQLECIHVASQTTSTKINKMLDILQETQQHYPNEKTIIFSQFTSMLDLMENPLKEKKIKFCRYDGSMSNISREKSLHSLRTDPDCKVMLISLKCGSLGLNLTAANRVILMDIWWNPAVEEQAIDRVHRIGQSLPVHVTRLIIKDTIEQKIIMLQQQKAMLVKGALGDQMINNTKLTYRELLSLFDIER